MVQAKEVKSRIESAGTNQLYVVSDFADLQNDSVVTRTLSRLAEDKMLVRIAQGLYLYPSRNRFGIQRPSIDEIAEALAEKEHAQIIPSGLTALNKLGLSTQVPMNAVYITNGTQRRVNVGNRTIFFKHCAPKFFAFCSRKFAMVVQAMKEIGEANMTADMLATIRKSLATVDEDIYAKDLQLAPQWIRRALNNMPS